MRYLIRRHRLVLSALALSAAATGLSGCVHLPPPGPLPNFAGPGAATLYVQRAKQSNFAVQAVHVVLDGATLGEINSGEYWRLRVKPGWHWLGTWEGENHIHLQPGVTRCYVIGYSVSTGPSLRRADTCPPPPGWIPTRHSGG